MKIKLTQALCNGIAKAAKDAVLHCIEENRMTTDFKVDEIEGHVSVGKTNGEVSFGSEAYTYSVTLFSNIRLIVGGLYVKNGTINMDIERSVLSALGDVVHREMHSGNAIPRLQECAIGTIKNPGIEHTFELHGELFIKMKYLDEVGSNSFKAMIYLDTKLISEHAVYGKDRGDMEPSLSNVFNILTQHVGGFQPTKGREFFITEHTSFQNNISNNTFIQPSLYPLPQHAYASPAAGRGHSIY